MKTIYVIPGLGTTKELMKEVKINDAELIALEWPLLEKGEIMVSFAKKIGSSIDDTKPFYLLGVSLGGMLCSEIAVYKHPVKIILISSCACRRELPWPVRAMKFLPVHEILSEQGLRWIAKRSRKLLGFKKEYISEFHGMIDSMKADYFTRTIDCIANWNKKNSSTENVFRIHGDADKLLPLKNLKADYIIKNGTHAMIVDSSEEINRILNNEIIGK